MNKTSCGLSTALVFLVIAVGASAQPSTERSQATHAVRAATAKPCADPLTPETQPPQRVSKATAEGGGRAGDAEAGKKGVSGATSGTAEAATKGPETRPEPPTRDLSAEKAPAALDSVRTDLFHYMIGGACGLGLVALALIVFALWSMATGGRFAYRSQWGGFGGGVSGWTLSPPATALIAASLLAGLAVMLLIETAKQTDPLRQAPAQSKESAATPIKATK